MITGGCCPPPNTTFPTRLIVPANLPYNLHNVSRAEIIEVLRTFKRRKAPGPDEISMEVFMEMGVELLDEVVGHLNFWFHSEPSQKSF